jgi:hypothetical protein
MTPEELRKARRSVSNPATEESGKPDAAAPSEAEVPDDQQRQMSRRADALIARQAEEARKKQEKK